MANNHGFCCGVRLWTTGIAWCQIIVSIMGTMLMTIVLVELIMLGPENLKAKYFKDAIDGAVSEYVYNIVMLLYQLGISIVGLFFGVLLLKGAANENTKYLKMWIGFAMVTMVYSIIAVGVQGFQARYSKGTVEVIGLIISATITLTFNGLSIYVVQDLVQEIKDKEHNEDEQPLIMEAA